ncbi:TlpA family protein disulfide reductase [Paracrocinitomix mangrovi]|uniref:TlpA family protein disulfide reductase n=1 Tax=Paracrocinitomix mangrovi TaxID=2862509 RepID=UPI001C8F0453|nr:TlpA disulfide reductase family protein [Paracrocinitomix mangrovi]UKN01913.1 TlpA family protein disulfide reductase [Paracrocinitomix mangrovi]
MSETHFTIENETPLPYSAIHWEVFDMDDKLYDFADFGGKPIVLNFWATWCSACRAEMPVFADLRSRFDKEISFLAVSSESLETIKTAGLHEDYDFIYGTQRMPDFFEVKYLPTIVIIDKNWNLVYKMTGVSDIDNDANINFLNKLVEN